MTLFVTLSVNDKLSFDMDKIGVNDEILIKNVIKRKYVI